MFLNLSPNFGSLLTLCPFCDLLSCWLAPLFHAVTSHLHSLTCDSLGLSWRPIQGQIAFVWEPAESSDFWPIPQITNRILALLFPRGNRGSLVSWWADLSKVLFVWIFRVLVFFFGFLSLWGQLHLTWEASSTLLQRGFPRISAWLLSTAGPLGLHVAGTVQ